VVAVTLERVSKKYRRGGDILARRLGEGSGSHEGQPGTGEFITALADVSLEVRDGETLSIIGPSGSGKSTLLRVVAGLEQPDTGRVLYNGKDMADIPPKERGIGMVFQNYALYPHMESRMNLGFFFLVRKRAQEIPERVRVTAEIMGLGFEQLLSRRPPELSGGQQQRVAIARCICRDPQLFLLDEPLSNLDAKLRSSTRVEIKRLLRRFGITTLYVTHDLTEALALGDRIAVLNEGKLEQVGPYSELVERPVNVFVATFVNTPPMNILPAHYNRAAHEAVIGAVHLALPPGSYTDAPSEILVGIRAQDVLPRGAPGVLPLAVEVVEPLIAERAQLVHGRLNGHPFTAKLSAECQVVPGQLIWLDVPPERIYVFDARTQRLLV